MRDTYTPTVNRETIAKSKAKLGNFFQEDERIWGVERRRISVRLDIPFKVGIDSLILLKYLDKDIYRYIYQ